MRITGRLLAFVAAVAAGLVAANLVFLVREVLRDPETWDGGRGPGAVFLALGIFGGGALILALVALPALIGVFVGPKSRRTALWFLVLPGVLGLLAAAGAAGALVALQPDGVQFLAPVAGPLAGPPLLALIAGVLARRGGRVAPPGLQPRPGQWPGQPHQPQPWPREVPPGQPWPGPQPQGHPEGWPPQSQQGQPQPPPQPPSQPWPPA